MIIFVMRSVGVVCWFWDMENNIFVLIELGFIDFSVYFYFCFWSLYEVKRIEFVIFNFGIVW